MLVAVAAVIGGGLVSSSLTLAATRDNIAGNLTVRSVQESAMLDSVGVNIHENFVDTTYAPNGDTAALVKAIRSSGVSWVRIGLKKQPFGYERAFLQALHKSGLKVLGIIGAPHSDWGDFETGDSGQLISALTSGAYAGQIDMLEMPNETDIAGGDWVGKLQTFDTEYFNALRANAMTRTIPIVGPSVGAESSCKALGALSSSQDYFNVHSYSGTSIPEYSVAENCRQLAMQGGLSKSQPLISTEFGWTNNTLDSHQGVSEATAATYLVRSYLWNPTQNIRKSFAYELFDQKPDPRFTDSQMHFGLVRVNGDPNKQSTWVQAPKPAFVALQHLTSVLRDTTSRGGSAVRVVAASGPGDAIVVQMIRGDGGVDVAVWLPSVADSTRTAGVTLRTDVNARATAVDLVTGAAVKLQTDGQHLTLNASVHPVVLRITGD